MRDFNRGGGSRGGDRGGSRGGDRGGFNRGGGGDREMFTAVCDECGRECQLPFKPSSNKPVYCSRCFEKYDPKKTGFGGDRGGDREDRGSRDFGGDRPDNREFATKRIDSNSNEKLIELLSSINAKLDRVIVALQPGKSRVKSEEVAQAIKEEVAEVVVKETPVVKEAKPKAKKKPVKK